MVVKIGPLLLMLSLPVAIGAAESDEPAAEAVASSGEATEIINGVEVPVSPGDPEQHSGERIWQGAAFTHWPAVVYHDEDRNLAFQLPVPPVRERDRQHGIERPDGAYHNPFGWQAGDEGRIGWAGGESLPLTLPEDPELDRCSGLLPLPMDLGVHRAVFQSGDDEAELALRVVDVEAPWPQRGLRDGFPVDADGVPVVMRERRRDPSRERQWAVLRPGLPRPEGRALVIGDPLATPAGSPFAELDLEIERRDAVHPRYAHHAAIVALAQLPEPLPATILWSPGNAPLYSHTWSPEEERLLLALRSRLQALDVLPRLILLLPPLPPERALRERAEQRRDLLRRSAVFLGWEVLDAQQEVGDPARATAFRDGLHSRYPVGEAAERLRAALRRALAR